MKVVVVQISDIHFEVKNEPLLRKSLDLVKKLIISLYDSDINSSKIIIMLLNGDIVNKGKDDCAYECFYNVFKGFFDDLNKIYVNKIIPLVVAGNHDCDDVEKNFNKFNNFQNKINSLTKCSQITKITEYLSIFSVDEIVFFLNNSSSVFSDLQQGEENVKYIKKGDAKIDGTQIINVLSNYKENFRVFVSHHPIDYLEDSNQRKIEELCKNYFNIVMCAHKHYSDKTNVSSKNKSYTIIQSGALLNIDNNDNVDIKESSFNILVLQCQEDKICYSFDRFEYKPNLELYSKVPCDSDCNFDFKKIHSKMPLTPKFESTFCSNPYYGSNQSLFEYFTFQPLVSNDNNGRKDKITNLNEFYDFIIENKTIYIEGRKYSGKTTLAKNIFEFFRVKHYKFPLYFSMKDFVKGDILNSVNLTIASTYNKGESEYLQIADLDSRLLIIDDVNEENIDDFKEVVDKNKSNFEYIIVFYDSNLMLNDEYKLLFNSDSCYKLAGFFGEQRNTLIYNIVRSDNAQDKDCDHIVKKIKYLIKNNSHFVFRDPLFLIIFIKYILKNFKKYTNDIKFDEIYSEVINEHITNIISYANNKKLDMNKSIEVLPIISYKLFCLDKNYLSYSKCLETMEQYYSITYGTDVISSTDILSLLIDSSLLININDNVYFNTERYFAYFLSLYFIKNDMYVEIEKLFDNPSGIAIDVLENIILLIKNCSKETNNKIKSMIIKNLKMHRDDNKISIDVNEDGIFNFSLPHFDNLNSAHEVAKQSNQAIDNKIDETIVTNNNYRITKKETLMKYCDELSKYNNIFLLMSRFIGSSKGLTEIEEKKGTISLLYDHVQYLSNCLFQRIITSTEFKKFVAANNVKGDAIEFFKCILYYAFIDCSLSNAYNYDLKFALLNYKFETIETKLIKLSIAIFSDDSEMVTSTAINLFKNAHSNGLKLLISAILWRYIGETTNLSEKNFNKLNNTIFKGAYNKKDFLNQKLKNTSL